MKTQAKWTQKQYFGVRMDYVFSQCDQHKGKQDYQYWWAKPDEPEPAKYDDEVCDFCLDGDDVP